MSNNSMIKLGVVVGSADWLPNDFAIDCRRKLVSTYVEEYDDSIYECPICLTDNEISIKRVLKDLKRAECNVVCLYYANYGPESVGALFVDRFSGPVIMLAAAEEGVGPFYSTRKDSLSGFINANYAMRLRGVRAYIPNEPIATVLQSVKIIHKYLSIAKTLLALRNLKIISISPRPSSYWASYSPTHTLFKLGVEVSEYSELELFNSFIKHENDRRIDSIVVEMEDELGEKGNKTPDILPKLAQYEITLTDWIRTHKGISENLVLTSTCWPSFPVSFGFVPCYVNSRLTKKGVPVACEADVYGALSEYIGQCISNDKVTILNINNNIPDSIYNKKIKGKNFGGIDYKQSDLFLGYHCGVTCSDKLESYEMNQHFINYQLIGEGYSQGTIQGQLAPGPITLLRVQADKEGSIIAYIAEGTVLPIVFETYGGQGIIAIREFGRFLRNVIIKKGFPNHTVVLFGHYARMLEIVLRQIGIEDIDYNHPAEYPYEYEIPISCFND